jgi:signal transduction histidine kinase
LSFYGLRGALARLAAGGETTGSQGAKEERFARRLISLRAHTVTVVIWVLFASIFLLDLMTPPAMGVCFAYVIPIFLSLFEARSRPVLYASAATVLTLAELFDHPNSDLSMAVVMVNHLSAVVTQWVVATLVLFQQRRLVDAQDKAEFQHRFVDILSHEIGTALTTVTGQAYRLTKLAEKLAPNDVIVRADKIQKAVESIQAIVTRIQFASALGDGSIPASRSSVNLHTMIQELAERLKEERQAESIQLSLCAKPLFVDGDEMLLRQVFENVIANSIKYSPANSRISIGVAKQGLVVRVTITDQGSGISPDELPRIRIPYYRGESSKGTRGVGLGLYLVERIVEAHRGRLLIESKVDQGTKVTIELPQTSDLVAA